MSRKRLDPAKTRESILSAAFTVFAERGFDGASIAEIAAAAKVPKSLLQYHFGTKEDLWNTCLAQKARPLLASLDRFLEHSDPASLAALVEARYHLLKENPQFARILAWISLGSGPVPDFIQQRRAQMRQTNTDSMSRQSFRHLHYALAAMDGWFLFGNLYRHVLGEQDTDQTGGDPFLRSLLGTLPSHDTEENHS